MYIRNKEHNSPHIHAIYGDEEVTFILKTEKYIKVNFLKMGGLVKQFIKQNKAKLLEMWETEKYEKLPPIK